MEYKIIKIKELSAFIKSDIYQSWSDIPISEHRAISYINNKRADENDVALIYLTINNQLVAYRSLFSDLIFENEKPIKLAWISGSWVHPKHRRKGFSMEILKMALQAWDNKLMFSNYAPNSKSLYDKSTFFRQVANIKGKRIYFRSVFSDVLPAKHLFFKTAKPLLWTIDFCINALLGLRLKRFKTSKPAVNFKVILKIDTKIAAFIATSYKNHAFKKTTTEMEHFLNYPWVRERKSKTILDNKYFFSSSAKQFFYTKIAIYNSENQVTGFIIIKIREGFMSLPFLEYTGDASKIVNILTLYVRQYKIKILECFDTQISSQIIAQKRLSIFAKATERRFFAHYNMQAYFKSDKPIKNGDGDNAYT